MILETERLYLREFTPEDYDALNAILGDKENMKYYPYDFDEKLVRWWIAGNQERYRVFGFGVWAVCLKESGEMIGDCGLSIQDINGRYKPEIGYHFRRDMQGQGYASEAARGVRDWTFKNTPFREVYSYMPSANVASSRCAMAYGCHEAGEFDDKQYGPTKIFLLTKEEWEKMPR